MTDSPAAPDRTTTGETAEGLIRNALQICAGADARWPHTSDTHTVALLEADLKVVARLLKCALAKLDGASGPPNTEERMKPVAMTADEQQFATRMVEARRLDMARQSKGASELLALIAEYGNASFAAGNGFADDPDLNAAATDRVNAAWLAILDVFAVSEPPTTTGDPQ